MSGQGIFKNLEDVVEGIWKENQDNSLLPLWKCFPKDSCIDLLAGGKQKIRRWEKTILVSEQVSNTDLRNYSVKGARI